MIELQLNQLAVHSSGSNCGRRPTPSLYLRVAPSKKMVVTQGRKFCKSRGSPSDKFLDPLLGQSTRQKVEMLGSVSFTMSRCEVEPALCVRSRDTLVQSRQWCTTHQGSLTQVWFSLVSMMLFTPSVRHHASSI